MKITTWNVNGIRAAFAKGFGDSIQTINPDILCLQEVKARVEQLESPTHDLFGYHRFWNAAERPGYSGVATFSNCYPDDIRFGLGIDKFDQEGRILHMRLPNFHLYNVYFPNGQRGKERVDFKLEFYAELLKEVDQLHARGEGVIITGDFNTAHREMDLKNPKQNALTSGFLPEERAWIDIYLTHGLVDAYRDLYPDRVQYTWWTYRLGARRRNIGWRLDYFLVSEPLMQSVQDVVIHEEIQGSDHCPVSLILAENCA